MKIPLFFFYYNLHTINYNYGYHDSFCIQTNTIEESQPIKYKIYFLVLYTENYRFLTIICNLFLFYVKREQEGRLRIYLNLI